jgi:NAD(P)-dependent dehydrogenase (short-subunit alcohol dehydrogenase family)
VKLTQSIPLDLERSKVKPVCLVLGAGAGIGGTVARRFAQEGYHACLCRRSDANGLKRLVEVIEGDGNSANIVRHGRTRLT